MGSTLLLQDQRFPCKTKKDMKIRKLKGTSSLQTHAQGSVVLLGVSASFDMVTHKICMHGTALRSVFLSSQLQELTARTDIHSLFSKLDSVF